jgi:hypothetical protein
MGSFLRIDGDEVPLAGARLMWQPALSGGRHGVLFHIAAHGNRHILHIAGWAPADHPADLTGQTVTMKRPGPDGAVDGRMFAAAEVRFGRVRDDRAVLSIDGEVEDFEPGSAARSTVEADIVCDIQPTPERRHCLACGRPLDDWAEDRDDFIGGVRVQLRVLPILCPDDVGFAEPPRFCPTCASPYSPENVHALSDAESVGYTALCPNGHTFSGQLHVRS